MNIRLTIDTAKDFELSTAIFSDLIRYKMPFGAQQIVNHIKLNPVWIYDMANEIKLNTK